MTKKFDCPTVEPIMIARVVRRAAQVGASIRRRRIAEQRALGEIDRAASGHEHVRRRASRWRKISEHALVGRPVAPKIAALATC